MIEIMIKIAPVMNLGVNGKRKNGKENINTNIGLRVLIIFASRNEMYFKPS